MSGKGDANPVTHFGRQVRKERVARGWSLDEMAARTGIAAAHWSRIENSKRPPTENVAAACDRVFPERRGWFLEYYEESKSWMPASFRNWSEYEDKASSLRVWSPSVIDGLLQTEGYARALLWTVPGVTEEMVNSRLRARIARQQRVLMRDDPPIAWFVVDELSLYRCAGSGEVMAEQMSRLAEVAAMPNVTMQVLPAVAHPASSSELIIGDGAAYVEHLTGGLVYTDETVTTLMRLFNTIHGESYRVSESLRIFERLGETWTGVSQLTPTPREGRASKQPPGTA